MSEPRDVELTWFEFVDAVNVGLYRFAASNLANLNAASTYERDWLQRLADDVVGACGERAYCKWSGSYWDGAVNTFHHEPDARGGVEIRTTTRTDGALIVRDNDSPARWYVLVTGAPPRFTIRGYMRGHDARQPCYVRNPNGSRPAWFVPQAALNQWENR